MIEQWRAIPGYEGLYAVSDLGHVRQSLISQIKLGKIRNLNTEQSQANNLRLAV